ncbi:hypothetical protein ACINK0_06295 [Deinococcus sp. VB343]|uniref:hypothetical protein n=1 Tax=Deinococcus sp. VB343 TaxID=3385567 RepID=UPI0039C8DCF1
MFPNELRAPFGIIFLCTVVAVGASFVRIPPSYVSQELNSDSCMESTDFNWDYPEKRKILESEIKYSSLSWITANKCQAGEIEFDVEPQKAGKDLPILSVIANNDSIYEESIDKKRHVKIKVPKGKINIGFFNPYYSIEARVVSLFDVRFQGDGCSSLKVTIPPETGGQWFKDTRSGSIVTDYPMTMEACGKGIIKFSVVGREAQGEFPSIKVIQTSGERTYLINSNIQNLNIETSTAGEIVKISVVNPFSRVNDLRQLKISNLRWSPLK